MSQLAVQFTTGLQQQAIIWLWLTAWVLLMIWIHTPPSRPPRKYTPTQKRYNLMAVALTWIGILLALRLIPA